MYISIIGSQIHVNGLISLHLVIRGLYMLTLHIVDRVQCFQVFQELLLLVCEDFRFRYVTTFFGLVSRGYKF